MADLVQIANIFVPLAAAVIGGLATAFFSKKKQEDVPVFVFDVLSEELPLRNIPSILNDNEKIRTLSMKVFTIENISDKPSDSLIIEFKNLKAKTGHFLIRNDPSHLILESYYEVTFSEERQSLRIVFKHFPGMSTFSTTLIIDDYWMLGQFKAHAKDAKISSRQSYHDTQQENLKNSISRLSKIFISTILFTFAMFIFIALRTSS